VSEKASPHGARPTTDDGYFEELTRAVFAGSTGGQVVDAKWPGFRRAFSKFSIRDVADYMPEDVDRLMSDPAIIKNLQKIEATIENAGEMLLIQIEHGSFADYLASFESTEEAVDALVGRFRQLTPEAAAAFIERVSGPIAV
jgi:DNA-3-methyladenine glycosylase I